MRRSAILGAALGTALATAGGAWYQLLRRPLPKTRGKIEVDGLGAPVEIRRDRWGVPHVKAGTALDLWFGQGVCHAQDRLWQMELHRRVGTGRLSEALGAETLPVDRLL